MKRVLGIDVGDRRIGVAVSDWLGLTAQGIETVHIKDQDSSKGINRIQEIAREYEATEIVVGLPKNMDGTIGDRGKKCEEFGSALEETLHLPVSMWDERLSSRAAERTLLEADMSRKKRKNVIDKMAAVMILQGYLDHQTK
ncbi:Holliday junction resolvase RuvX [Salsuginibacillus kocurii]|uniref:Holliday junction resolvase RuvX n=1 Tax=Salsuginibacillus kocurii TaxID=427078 RepID=UPI00036D4666|nr:Holliday junction resolvase RuvX [Salsuginibacillus kocurii]